MTEPPANGDSPAARETAADRARRIAKDARDREAAERRALADRVDELERRGRTPAVDLDVPEALASLHERIEALEEKPRKGNLREPFDWDDLDQGQHTQLLAELHSWIDDVLNRRYRAKLGRRGVPPAWAEHPHLRDVLTAAWLAWLYAYKNPGGRLTEQWQWHRDVLAHLGPMLEEGTPAPGPDGR